MRMSTQFLIKNQYYVRHTFARDFVLRRRWREFYAGKHRSFGRNVGRNMPQTFRNGVVVVKQNYIRIFSHYFDNESFFAQSFKFRAA